jgi:hypothetical protein
LLKQTYSTLLVALVLFGLAGSAVMVAVPGLFAGPVRPEFTVFLVAGVAAIYTINFIEFLRHPEGAIIGYKG